MKRIMKRMNLAKESFSNGRSNIRIVGSDKAPITLQNVCPICGKPHTIEVDMDHDEFLERLFTWKYDGELIQRAFPMFDDNQREFIKTGICPKCWEETMGLDEYDESCKNRNGKKMVKESYEVSPELADKLNSILADEFIAHCFYRLAELAMKGNKQHRLSEIADENGEDELEDHFKNLSEWMQSKGIRVVTNHDEMLDITNATVFTVEDGDSTKDIVDKLIQSEEEAIEAYENLIPDTDLDLHTMLCGFLKDEREHLKALQDAKDEMGGSRYDGEDKPKHTIYEGIDKGRPKYWNHLKATNIQWDVDDQDDLKHVPDEMWVAIPPDVEAEGPEAIEEYMSDYITDNGGFCHNGFDIE